MGLCPFIPLYENIETCQYPVAKTIKKYRQKNSNKFCYKTASKPLKPNFIL